MFWIETSKPLPCIEEGVCVLGKEGKIVTATGWKVQSTTQRIVHVFSGAWTGEERAGSYEDVPEMCAILGQFTWCVSCTLVRGVSATSVLHVAGVMMRASMPS